MAATLDLDRSPFSRGIAESIREAEKFAKRTFTAKLGLDAKSLSATLDSVEQRLGKLDGRRVDATVGVDTGEADAELASINAIMDKIDRRQVTAEIRADGTQAFEHLELVQQVLDHIDGERVTAHVDVDSRGAERGLARVEGGLASTGGGMGGLIALAGTLGPALVPIFAATASSALGLASAVGVAGAGLGLFGAGVFNALSGIKEAGKTLNQAEARLSKAVPGTKQYADALAQVAVAQQKYNDAAGPAGPAIDRLKAGWDKFGESTRKTSLPFLAAGADLLAKAIGLAAPAANAVGKAVIGLVHRFGGFEKSTDGFHRVFGYLEKNAPGIVTKLGFIIGNVALGIGRFFGAVGSGKKPLDDLLKWARGFADAMSHTGDKGSPFQRFLEYGRKNGPVVAAFLRSIGGAVGHLLQAFSGAGGNGLSALSLIADAVVRIPVKTLSTLLTILPPIALAFKVLTLAMAAFNLIADANPFVLLGVALVAVGIGLYELYKHSARFRAFVNALGDAAKWLYDKAIKPAFAAIATAAVWLFDNVLKPGFHAIAGFITNDAGPAFVWLWHKVIVPAFHGIAAVVGVAWGIIKVIFADFKVGLRILGDVFTWLYRNVIHPVFTVIRTIIEVVWNVVKAILILWGAAFYVLGKAIQIVWQHYWSPILHAIGDLIGWLWKNVAKPIFGFIGDAFSGLGKNVKAVWDDIVHPALKAFGDVMSWLWSKAIKPALGFIADAFSALKKELAAPIAFVIHYVYNDAIRPFFNDIAAATGQKTRLSKITPPTFATGGPVYGAGTATSDSIPALLSNGEHVLTAREVAAAGGHAAIEDWRRSLVGYARGGSVDGKGGGIISWEGGRFTPTFAAHLKLAQQMAGVMFHIFQGGWRPTTSYSGSTHNKDAVDLGAVTASNVKALRANGIAAWARGPAEGFSLRHIHGVPLPGFGTPSASAAAQARDYLRGGNGLGGKDNGLGSGDHSSPGGALGGLRDIAVGAIDLLSGPLNKVKSLVSGLVDKIPGGGVGIVGKAMRSLPGTMLGWAKDFFNPFSHGSASSAGPTSGGGGSSANQSLGHSIMTAMGFAESNWPSLLRLWNGESGWRTNATNASSGAYGIPQSLPASKMRSAGADWRTNPATQIKWGLNYIRGRYGNPGTAYADWLGRKPHWYDGGGDVAPGLTPAIMNGTGRVESVITGPWRDQVEGDLSSVKDGLAKLAAVIEQTRPNRTYIAHGTLPTMTQWNALADQADAQAATGARR